MISTDFFLKKVGVEENKMAEEQADVEYISLHGYIRTTHSDTEVLAEHQLRADGSPRPLEKSI